VGVGVGVWSCEEGEDRERGEHRKEEEKEEQGNNKKWDGTKDLNGGRTDMHYTIFGPGSSVRGRSFVSFLGRRYQRVRCFHANYGAFATYKYDALWNTSSFFDCSESFLHSYAEVSIQ
jgi:hypothetical protein